jgi:hypothetical protein
MIQASDIEKIIALPGGVEIQYRGEREAMDGYRPTVELTFDWGAAERVANDLYALCVEQSKRERLK